MFDRVQQLIPTSWILETGSDASKFDPETLSVKKQATAPSYNDVRAKSAKVYVTTEYNTDSST